MSAQGRPTGAAGCAVPLDLETLVSYWLGEFDPSREASVEEHLLGCGRCAERLAETVRLGDAIRTGFVRGDVSAVLSDAFVADLGAAGWQVREYRVATNGSVRCSVAPDDDLTIARLEAPLAGIERLDLVRSSPDGVLERLGDVPFDADAGVVVFAPAMNALRSLADQTVRVELVDASGASERIVARYDFIHAAWKG